MMKRLFSFLLALSMLCSWALSETPGSLLYPAAQAKKHVIETKGYPLYLNSAEPFFGEPQISLVDGVRDLPYMDVQNCMKLVTGILLLTSGGRYSGLKMTAEIHEENQVLMITRENGQAMVCDFQHQTITWPDYYAFFMDCSGAYMDQVNLPAGVGPLKRVRSRDRFGEVTVLDLKKYEIPMIAQDGLYLLPLQTLSAFFIHPFTECDAYFNQEALILATGETMVNPLEGLMARLQQAGLLTEEMLLQAAEENGGEEEQTEGLIESLLETEEGKQILAQLQAEYEASLYKVYAGDAPKEERSAELCLFGCRELILELDTLYGLKEAHDITSFEMFLAQTGLTDGLVDPDPEKADQALYDLTTVWLDDLHSGVYSRSYLSPGSVMPLGGEGGITQGSYRSVSARMSEKRSLYPEAQEPYYECGDTAYVTFDEFKNESLRDYRSEAKEGTLTDIAQDNVSLIHYAHQQITREGSPIKNVVLDLSNNSGGMVTDALLVLSWFLGDAQLSVYNTFARSAVTTTYRADVNLDGEYDERDTVSHLNLYCLISPVSFSCGNLVPWAFKADGRVCLLGQTSGGGSCLVGDCSTAWGTAYRISSPFRLSFQKNGSYYDVDRGVEPHVTITNPAHFYDREALTKFIHGLF